MENACYTIEVRGSEIPKSHLAGVFRSSAADAPGFGYEADAASTVSE